MLVFTAIVRVNKCISYNYSYNHERSCNLRRLYLFKRQIDSSRTKKRNDGELLYRAGIPYGSNAETYARHCDKLGPNVS